MFRMVFRVLYITFGPDVGLAVEDGGHRPDRTTGDDNVHFVVELQIAEL